MNRSGPLKLLIQSSAIVGSILLAFGIDAWWSEQQETEQKERLLEALETETMSNLAEIEAHRGYRLAVASVCAEILAVSDESIGINKFDMLLGDLLWWPTLDLAMGATTTLVDGGKLALVDDPDLSLQISHVRNYMEKVDRVEQQDYELVRDKLLPLLSRAGSLPQMSNVMSARGIPGELSWATSPKVSDAGGRDHRHFLVEDEFRGVVLLKQWSQTDALNAYEKLESLLNELLKILRDR